MLYKRVYNTYTKREVENMVKTISLKKLIAFPKLKMKKHGNAHVMDLDTILMVNY